MRNDGRRQVFSSVALLAAVLVTQATAQERAATDTATPGAQYEAGGFYRFLFGSSYRDLWTTPITVEILDLRATGNGLTPTGIGGGQQTLNLRFMGADGLPYTFRGLDKDPTSVLPEELQESVAADVVQDQVSSAFPTAPPVVEAFLLAAGGFPRGSRLVIMPDDPLLGEYREQFGGRLGTIETWANERAGGEPGFAGATDVISTDELWQKFLADPHSQVDLPSFLEARLLDIFIGDWDRHRGQWRWGNIGPGDPPSWEAFPEDRDQAFARYDGALFLLAGKLTPQLTSFGKKYSPILGAAWNGRDLDRWLLPRLEKPVWDSVALALQEVLTDQLIEDAVGLLPASHYALRGEFLIESLQARRDKLPEMAEKYYRHIASQVDFELTDVAEDVEAVRGADGSLTLTLYAAPDGNREATPYLTRLFEKGETREVRLHLRGGNDRVTVSGQGGGVILRVLSEAGSNTVVDTVAGKRTRVYDDRDDGLEIVGRVDLDDREWDDPPTEAGELPPRDWGTMSFPIVWAQWSPDLGFTAVGGYEHRRFGFRKQPYAQRHRLLAAFSFKKLGARGSYDGVFVREGSRDEYAVGALASSIEINNFYGFGNNTTSDPGRDFFKTDQNDFRLALAYRPYLGGGVRGTLGAKGRYTTTSDQDPTLITITQPYGFEDFAEVAGTVALELDQRDRPAAATKGIWAQVTGNYFPAVLSVADSGAFGEVNGFVAGYITPFEQVTLALRAGGKKVWGTFPFQESAFLGGLGTLRGYRDQRFAGDASVYFNSTLRLHLAEVFALVPSNIGLVGIFDAGRVWLDGVSEGDAHFGYGGGVYFAPLKNPKNAVVVAAASGDDGMLFYFQLGFAY